MSISHFVEKLNVTPFFHGSKLACIYYAVNYKSTNRVLP